MKSSVGMRSLGNELGHTNDSASASRTATAAAHLDMEAIDTILKMRACENHSIPRIFEADLVQETERVKHHGQKELAPSNESLSNGIGRRIACRYSLLARHLLPRPRRGTPALLSLASNPYADCQEIQRMTSITVFSTNRPKLINE